MKITRTNPISGKFKHDTVGVHGIFWGNIEVYSTLPSISNISVVPPYDLEPEIKNIKTLTFLSLLKLASGHEY